MEEQKNPIETFDYLYTTNHIQIMKMALPYLPSSLQPFLAVMIKFLELSYTITIIKQPAFHDESTISPQQLTFFFKDIAKYLTKEEQKQVSQIQSLIQGMEQFKQMQEMMKMFDVTGDSNSFASYFSDFDQYMSNHKTAQNAPIYPFTKKGKEETNESASFISPINMLSMMKSASSDHITDAINTIFPPDS